MQCSFDKQEYCPMEQIDNSNSKWNIETSSLSIYSKYKLTSSPKSGANFVNLNGLGKKSSIQTPIISTERVPKGQCLSFYYFLNGDTKLEVNKVNLDGTVQMLFGKQSQNLSLNTWKKAFVSIQSSIDYFVEFNGAIGKKLESIVALDDIEMGPLENCLALMCSFDDDSCKPNSVLNESVSSKIWIKETFFGTNSSYLRADIAQISKNTSSFYGFPLVIPIQSTMCLSFIYLLHGLAATELRLGILQSLNHNYIWKEVTLTSNTKIFNLNSVVSRFRR